MNPSRREDNTSVHTVQKKQKTHAMMLTLTIILAITLATTAITPTALIAQEQILCNDEGPNIVGTSGNDNIVGTPNEDTIALLKEMTEYRD